VDVNTHGSAWHPCQATCYGRRIKRATTPPCAAGLARAQEHPAHGALHGACAGSVQGFLAMTMRLERTPICRLSVLLPESRYLLVAGVILAAGNKVPNVDFGVWGFAGNKPGHIALPSRPSSHCRRQERCRHGERSREMALKHRKGPDKKEPEDYRWLAERVRETAQTVSCAERWMKLRMDRSMGTGTCVVHAPNRGCGDAARTGGNVQEGRGK
jgi:hypothetical protein